MRIVIDTSVLVAALRSSRGASHQILRRLPERSFTPLISVPLILEYESVLKRQTQLDVHGISPADIDALLDVWAAYARPVRLHYLWRLQLRENDDEMVLETAINGRARAIVTHNCVDFAAAGDRFGVAIWTPADLLEHLRPTP